MCVCVCVCVYVCMYVCIQLKIGVRPRHKPKKRFRECAKGNLKLLETDVDSWEVLAGN